MNYTIKYADKKYTPKSFTLFGYSADMPEEALYEFFKYCQENRYDPFIDYMIDENNNELDPLDKYIKSMLEIYEVKTNTNYNGWQVLVLE